MSMLQSQVKDNCESLQELVQEKEALEKGIEESGERVISEVSFNEMQLESRDFFFGGLQNRELQREIEKLRNEINELWKEKLRIKHKSNLEIDLKYRAKMERELCIYFLKMSRISSHKNTRKWGKKLYNLIQNL